MHIVSIGDNLLEMPNLFSWEKNSSVCRLLKSLPNMLSFKATLANVIITFS